MKPVLKLVEGQGTQFIKSYRHETLEDCQFYAEEPPVAWLVTDNESNTQRLYNSPNQPDECKKDSFHRYVIQGETKCVSAQHRGTKASPYYKTTIEAGATRVWRFRLICGGEGSGQFGMAVIVCPWFELNGIR